MSKYPSALLCSAITALCLSVSFVGTAAQAQTTRPYTTITGSVNTGLFSIAPESTSINDISTTEGTLNYSDNANLVEGVEDTTVKATVGIGDLKDYSTSAYPSAGFEGDETSGSIESSFYDTATNISSVNQYVVFSLYLNADSDIALAANEGNAYVQSGYSITSPVGGVLYGNLVDTVTGTHLDPNNAYNATTYTGVVTITPGETVNLNGYLQAYSQAGWEAQSVADAHDTADFYFTGETPGSIVTASGHDYATPAPEASSVGAFGMMIALGVGSLAIGQRKRLTASSR